MARDLLTDTLEVFLKAVQAMNRYLDDARILYSDLDREKDLIESQSPVQQHNSISNIINARESEYIFHADNVKQAFRSVCYSQGVDIPYDELGFRQAWEAFNRYNQADGEFANSGRNHYFRSRNLVRSDIVPPNSMWMWRLTEDEWGQPIQSGFPQDNQIIIESDLGVDRTLVGINSRKQIPSILRVSPTRQVNENYGHPTAIIFTSTDRHNNSGTILNHSFFSNALSTSTSLTDGGTPTEAQLGWTTAATVGYRFDDDLTFRDYYSLKIDQAVDSTVADYLLEQDITRQISYGTPYLPVVLISKDSSLSATFRITLGDKTQTFTNSDISGINSVNAIAMDRDLDLWPRNWQSTSTPNFKFEVTVLGAGSANIYGIVLIPGTFHPGSGSWFFAVTGTVKPEFGSFGSFSDIVTSSGSEGKVAKVVNLIASYDSGNIGAYVTTTGTTLIEDPNDSAVYF